MRDPPCFAISHLPSLCSLALVLSGQIASAEDNAEPPVSQNENDPAFADKQPVDPVAIEKTAADVRQVPLTEDMVNRFIASFKDMREVAKKFPNTKLPDSVIDEALGRSSSTCLRTSAPP